MSTDLPLSTRLGKSIGFRLSHLGERLGISSLIYNPWIMLEFDRHALRDSPLVVRALRRMYPAANHVFDVGSGTGLFAAEFNRSGGTSVAVERSNHGRKMARHYQVNCLPFDLTREPPAVVQGPFDLVYCFEVAEHLTPALGMALVRFLTSFPTRIVFTAAQPGQGGVGHINEQPKEYWIQRFQQHDFEWRSQESQELSNAFNEERCAFWFVRNVLVFTPKAEGRMPEP